jgi:hypothetical protein
MNHESNKMLKGPNDPIQVKLPRYSIDASIALKKDNVNTGISDESKQDAKKKKFSSFTLRCALIYSRLRGYQ